MKEYISYRQSVFLLAMIVPITGHMLILPSLFSLGGRDSWIGILFALPIGFFFGFVLYRLHTLHPSKTLIEMLEYGFGRFVGKGLSLGLLAYFFYIALTTFYGLFDFIQVLFLPETPRWAISIAFYIVILYLIRTGIESITRMSESLLLIISLAGVALSIATLPEKDYRNLFPLFEHGSAPVLNSISITTALFGEFVILLMLKLKKDYARAKSLLFTNSILVLIIAIMSVGITTSTLMIFGLAQSANFEYPAQNIVRIVEFGFIQRFDFFGLATMVLGCVIRMSTFQLMLSSGIQQWLGVSRGKWWVHGWIAAFLFLAAFMGIHNDQQYDLFLLNTLYPLSAILSVGIPVLVWIVLEIKQTR